MADTEKHLSVAEAFFAHQLKEQEQTPEPTPEVPDPKPETVIVPLNAPEPDPIPPAAEVVTPVVEPVPYVPEFKSDKDRFVYEKILSGDEEEIYQLLNEKYAHKSMSADNKILAYLAIQNPGLDSEDLQWEAAHKFGIGATSIDESIATDEEIKAFRQQTIDRKKLLSQADTYFNERASKTELPKLPSVLETDTEYKTYKETAARVAEQERLQIENQNQIFAEIDNTAPNISTIETEIKIKVDDSELAVNLNFALDSGKQKQLAAFAKTYTPSQEQYDAFNNSETGKFDYKGYMTSLAYMLFPKQMMGAVAKQAIATDRERFVEGTLKNSTLRNNDTSREMVTADADPYTAYWNAKK